MGVDSLRALVDAGEDGAGDHLRTDLERALAAGRDGGFDGVAGGLALAAGALGERPQARPQVLAFDRDPLLLAGRHHDEAAVTDQVAELGIGVAVAVGVFEDDEVAEPVGVPELADHPVVDGDDRRPLRAEDVDPARGGGGGDDFGGVAVFRTLTLLQGGPSGDVVGVAGVGRDREMRPLGEARQRTDEVGGKAAVGAGVEEHLLHVPVGMVVGEDRLVEVVVAAGQLQVMGGGADRVDGVVRVFLAVAVGVEPELFPARGEELHPADRAGAGDVGVGAEGGLDFVDRGEHLPGDPVFGAAGLVDRQQEGRDFEAVDDEVGDADRGRPEGGDRRRRVGDGGGATVVVRGTAVRPLRRRLIAAAVGARRGDGAAAAAAGVAEDFVAGDAALAGAAPVDRGSFLDAAALALTWVGRGSRGRGGNRGSFLFARSWGGGGLADVLGGFAVGVFVVGEAVAVVVEAVGARRRLQRGDGGGRRRVDRGAFRERLSAREGGAQRGYGQEAGDCE